MGSAGTEDSPELHRLLKTAAREQHFRYAPIILSREEEANYYEGFSNEVLWPLFHDLQSRGVFDPTYWDFYRRVNRKFADAVEDIASERDVIWVHDYQLMQVGRALRERRPHAFLSFFLHIPFPSPDIFGKLPWRCEVLEACWTTISSDCRRRAISETWWRVSARISRRPEFRGAAISGWFDRPGRHLYPRHSDQHRLPRLREKRSGAGGDGAGGVIRGQSPEMEIALGIDRLDYTKGIPERLRGLRAFPELSAVSPEADVDSGGGAEPGEYSWLSRASFGN